MTIEWKRLAAGTGLTVAADHVRVDLSSGRQHQVFVRPGDGDQWRFWAVVARPSALRRLARPMETLPWELNRSSKLVGYRYDEHGRLVGESWAPGSATPEEFQFVVRQVARECDRMELRLTGEDEF